MEAQPQPGDAPRGGSSRAEASGGGGGFRLSSEAWLGLGIFGAALAIRLIYLFESADSPIFFQPVVDANTHHELARGFAEGSGLKIGFFWRPFFYPFYLSLLYSVSGSSLMAAKLFQVSLGALTCLLTYRLGRRVFGTTTGLLAGGITALYAPLIFWEPDLVAAGWAAFWSVVLVTLLLRAAAEKTLDSFLLLGLCGSLATITRPSFLPFLLAAGFWLALVLVRSEISRSQVALRLAVLLLAFLPVMIGVGVASHRVTGSAHLLPTAGGVNLYLGNNPDTCETLNARPGPRWQAIADLPRQEGYGTKEGRGFFRDKALAFARDEPAAFLSGLARKAAQFANGREIPRNVEIYQFREWSVLLRGLVWKAGRFGFPWGVLFPLAVLGLMVHGRRTPIPMVLFAILYPLVIILVFVAGRYRVPMLPILSILAAAGCTGIAGWIREGRRLPALLAGGCAIGIAILASLPGYSCEEEFDYASELKLTLATHAVERGDVEIARGFYQDLLRTDPDSALNQAAYGNFLLEQGEFDRAIAFFTESLRVEEQHFVFLMRGMAYTAIGDLESALLDFNAAIELNPDWMVPYARRAAIYQKMNQRNRAREEWKRVLAMARAKGVARHSNIAERARAQLRRLGERNP